MRLAGWFGAARLALRAARMPLPRRGLAERLANIPLQGAPVAQRLEIFWDAHHIPYVQAGTDGDAAIGLGIVHAHLRLAQLEIMRRVAFGRVAEMIGPLGVELDRTLRLMQFGRAVPEIIAGLSPQSRAWAEGFLQGVNHVLLRAPALPPEMALLGMQREPWSLTDLFTMARLAAADVSWIVFARLIRARGKLGARDWQQLWPRLLAGGTPWPDAAGATAAILRQVSRGGSNAAAVAGARAAGGAAMIASDPHLGLALPPLWIIAGLHSPGFNVVGLMLPGFPLFALGRNRDIAWGGTSLHAASSDLIDISALPESEIAVRHEQVHVRWSRPRRVHLRSSPAGPVVSDGLLLRTPRRTALRWAGHQPSDEMGAFLGVMRAASWEEFQAAFAGFAVPAQNMVFAGGDGRVGHLLAARLPWRDTAPPPDLYAPPDPDWDAAGLHAASAHSFRVDPPDGIIASANDRPDFAAFPVGYFFSPPDRARRLHQLLSREGLTTEDLRLLQLDELHPGALAMRDHLLARLGFESVNEARARRALDAWSSWDGRYAADARGPVVHEAVLAHLAATLRPKRLRAPLAALWTSRLLLAEEISQTPDEELVPALRAALDVAARSLRRYRSWGGMHRLFIGHHLARIPLIGRRFRHGVFPVGGGNDTVNKTGTGFTARRHLVGFGSCARHVSDMAEDDANFFALLGGNDGWLRSSTATDQVALWRAGKLIRLPLRPQAARAAAQHVTVLDPG